MGSHIKREIMKQKDIEILGIEQGNSSDVPYYKDGVQAGFPSPADDFVESKLSLDKRFLYKPNSTFIVRVAGESMCPTLEIDDILVVRSDLIYKHNKICIVSVNNNEFTVKRFDEKNRLLIADNPEFDNISIQDTDEIRLLGVVTTIVREC